MNGEQPKQEPMQKVKPIGLDEVNTSTRLLDKHFSPLIVRKYRPGGWPLFVALICDVSLSDLDKVVIEYMKAGKYLDDIQWIRNKCGGLNEHIINHYYDIKEGCVEGVAVLWYVDKMFVSSLWGDFMDHASCKQELYAIINTLPHI
ncbi:MAG: hypothetical protein ACTSX1_13270 [Candidatus Heimdallarchaeaceae archaeon]